MPRPNKSLPLTVVASVFLAGCVHVTSPVTNTPPAGQTVPDTSTQAPATPQDQSVPVKEFDLTARQWEFNPPTITVDQGDKVKLNIESLDVAHGIALPEFNVSADLAPGQTTTVEFVADKTGSFTFFCNVLCGSGHQDMKGTLIVQ